MRLGHITRSSILLATLVPALASAKDYKSAEYITRSTYGFGAFEARIRAPEGPGVIGTFFLWRPGSETPQVPWEEIDFEFGPSGGDYQTQIMTPGPPDQTGRTEHQVYFSLPTGVHDAFYTYRIEWTPQYIAFYVNGTRVRYETDQQEYVALFNVDGNGDTPSNERMEVRLGLWPALSNIYGWAGRFDGTTVPTAQYVDYIKIWDYTPNAANPFQQLLLSDEFDNLRWDRWYAANWTFEFSASDYVSNNIGIRDGILVLGLTDNPGQGQLPELPPEDPPALVGYGSIIEAEDFDVFYERTPFRYGDHGCSNTSVDAQLVSDPIGGRCNVGWAQSGEWLEYYVDVIEPGYYDLNLRASSGSAAMSLHVEVDGLDVAGALPAPGLGWHDWAYMTAPNVYLAEGPHVVRVVFDTGDINFNFIAFDRVVETDPTTSDALDAGVSGETSSAETTSGDPATFDASSPETSGDWTSEDPISIPDASVTDSVSSGWTSWDDPWTLDASVTEVSSSETTWAETTTTGDLTSEDLTSVTSDTQSSGIVTHSSETPTTDDAPWTEGYTSSEVDTTSEPVDPEVPLPTAEASLYVFTDWQSGYCAELRVASTTGVTSWEVDLRTPGATIYTSWNTTTSGSAPNYTFGPVAWNSVIPAGASRVVGFCANRQSMRASPTVTTVRAF